MVETGSISGDQSFETLTAMDEHGEICTEDFLEKYHMEDHAKVSMETENNEEHEEEEEETTFLVKKCHNEKLRELLRNLCLPELKICSEASKEFISLLKSDSGGELLHQYVEASPSCTELMEAWKLQKEKPGLVHVFSLISVILDHANGKYSISDSGKTSSVSESTHSVSRRLDKFARTIVELKLDDVYRELNSGETRRQNAALLLMAAVVRRSIGLASEVAKSFDFTLKVLPKLAEYKQRKGNSKKGEKQTKSSTRSAFIKFAMSFLEASNPRLLRWVLQKKEIYSGVLRGLGCDDDKTVVFVLSTLQSKVLNPDSLVPPGLQSVLFGDFTLEQLSSISGNPEAGSAADLAHKTLMMVCTDPSHGLMPEFSEPWSKQGPLGNAHPLKGNTARLLRLMLRLRAAEIGYHRDLLLAIVAGSPSLASAYMDSFPYNIEPRGSPLWFGAISLASDVISAANKLPPFASLALQSHEPPTLDSPEMQHVLKCIIPRSFTRLVINRGLLHSDFLVKHGSLRLLLEALKSLDNLIGSIKDALESMTVKQALDSTQLISSEGLANLNGLPGISALVNGGDCLHTAAVGNSCTKRSVMQKWVSRKQEIQDEIRAMLPDPQVLLKLLSSLNQCHSKKMETRLKRERTFGCSAEVPFREGAKKLKCDAANKDIDIFISGISSEMNTALTEISEQADEEADGEKERMSVIAEIWGLEPSRLGKDLTDAETYFHSKLLDVLTLYLRTMPIALAEGTFDFFKLLPSNPLILSVCQQQSLLSLLIEYIGQFHGSGISIRAPELMLKHLQPLINLMIYSPVKGIRDQAHVLARTAMLSTGAFSRNISEIETWFLFFPGYNRDQSSVGSGMVEISGHLSAGLVSFFCDAVSTLGNNMYKYLDNMRCLLSKCQVVEDISPDFSPLFICILQKCLRLLESESGTFNRAERSMISIYVSNTLTFFLQTQVKAGLLSAVVDSILTEKFEDDCCANVDSEHFPCKWRSLKNLQLFAQNILRQLTCCNLDSLAEKTSSGNGHSLSKAVRKAKKVISRGNGQLAGAAEAFSSSIICATPGNILDNFPSIVTVAQYLYGTDHSVLSSIFFLEPKLLTQIANLWPDMFFYGLEMVVGEKPGNSSISVKAISTSDLDSTESAAFGFGQFLKHAPFYALFPAITRFSNENLLGFTKTRDLLLNKLSKASVDGFIPLLRLVLFWIHQIEESYVTDPSTKLEQLLETCFVFVEHMLMRVLAIVADSDAMKTSQASAGTRFVQEVVEMIFYHPAMTGFLSRISDLNEEPVKGNFGSNLEACLCSAKKHVHPFDLNIVHLLKVVADFIAAQETSWGSISKVHDDVHTPVVMACKHLIRQSLLVFRDKFDLCMVENKDLGPFLSSFYIFSVLMYLISPFELLELVYWMLCRVELDYATGLACSKLSALSVSFYVAEAAFNMLSSYFQVGHKKAITCCLFWEIKSRNFDVRLLERVYYKITEFAICYRIESADLCLLRAVNAVYIQRSVQPETALLPLSMFMLRMITSSPMEVLFHCIYKTSKVKANILFQITEISPLHLSLFGQVFLSVLDKNLLPSMENLTLDGSLILKNPIIDGVSDYALSDEELIFFLPVALSYFNSFMKFRKPDSKLFVRVTSFYSRILLGNFSNWKHWVSGDMFKVHHDEDSPLSMDELLDFFSNSLLGKAVCMLQFYFILNEKSMRKKKRMKLFNSIYACSDIHDRLLGCDVDEINLCSFEQSFDLINRAIAKISLSRVLLFPQKTNESCKTIHLGKEPNGTLSLKLGLEFYVRFMNCLVSTLDNIVKRFPLKLGSSEKLNKGDCSQLFRFLEATILKNLFELSKEMRSYLMHLEGIPFLRPLTRSCLLHRFEDPTTLKTLRSIVLLLSEGEFCWSDVFELLLAHSQFVPTILWSESTYEPSSLLSHTGALLRPMSSILKLLVIPGTDQSAANGKNNQDALVQRKLETVKLLRVLYLLKTQQNSIDTAKDVGMNSRELISLLLSGYGATLSETDLEIFNLMEDIESAEGSGFGGLAEMDYLWGICAIERRRDQTFERMLSSDSIVDSETAEECRKRRFRENIPVGSRTCAMTVLHFCYDRIAWTGPTSLKQLQEYNLADMPVVLVKAATYHYSATAFDRVGESLQTDLVCQACTILDMVSKQPQSSSRERISIYDPAFILRFSIHGLSRGYIEPMEFAGLGLLAVVFISMSSPDEGIRKLGYDSLGRYKKALENCQNKKEGLRLRLLLTSLQNGIVEPWQKIPTVIAIFAAEASFILMNPMNHHYLTINQLLMRSPRMDLESIPLFYTLFGSSSIHFQRDREWILRLFYAGLNLVDDARIVRKKFLFEVILSFYPSSLANYESKTLVLQIVKKAVKLHMLARYLVVYCGLIPWLSSVLSFCGEGLYTEHRDLVLSHMAMVLEVVNDIISYRIIVEWLRKYSLEQLSELSSHLHRLFVHGTKSLMENVPLVNSILHILTSTLRISQKRRMYQPHFSLSFEGLFQIYKAIDDEFNGPKFCLTAKLGLRTILMSTPLAVVCHKDKVKLSRLVMWAISTALQQRPKHTSQLKQSEPYLPILSEEHKKDGSLVAKLLRWVTASVILGRISSKFNKLDALSAADRPNRETLQSLLETIEKGHGGNTENDNSFDEALALIILYLQQLVGMNCTVLPSVVSALHFLLPSVTFRPSGTEEETSGDKYENPMETLCLKIRCPVEANPAWRWSFYQPWKDLSSELTDAEKLQEHQACRTQLIMFSNALGGRLLGLPALSHRDVEKSGLLTWEIDQFLEDE